ncbi:hypothetical protein PENTCL1PPCAC_11783, partial [Pristionchus entomophagus]
VMSLSPPLSIDDIHPFDPNYLPAAIRNIATMCPGLIAVFMLLSIIMRNKKMFDSYKCTVVFLTFGGFSLAIPIISFNIFMVIVIPLRPQFLISTIVCSSIKQFCAATMNSSFAVASSISLLRYLLVISGKEFGGGILIGVYFALSAPLYIYFVLSLCMGTISKNDECPYFIEIEWEYRPLLYFGYLSLIIILADLCNIRVLLFILAHRRKLAQRGSSGTHFSRKDRDQFNLSIGLLVQSITVTITFGSTILFMLLYSYGVAVPTWLSTITNTLSSLSTLLNPLACAIFIRPFRLEMLKSLQLHKVINLILFSFKFCFPQPTNFHSL